MIIILIILQLSKLEVIFRIGSVTKGVHQGAPLSMLLSTIYNNDLLDGIKSLGCGATIGPVGVSCPAFADDVCLVATHNISLQRMLDYAFNHSLEWKYQFNPKKSHVVIINSKSMEFNFSLGNNKLAIVESAVHLGIPLSDNPALVKKHYEDRIGRGRRSVYATHGLGSLTIPVPPSVSSKIYWSVSVPQMLYGIEVVPLNRSLSEVFEKNHIKIAKTIQGLPQQTPNLMPLATLGWSTMESVLDIMKLIFLWHLLILPMNNVYKRLCVYILTSTNFKPYYGPLGDLIRIVNKYDLTNIVVHSLTLGEYSSRKWKRIVKLAVFNSEKYRWMASIHLYKSLKHVACSLNYGQVWPWWNYVGPTQLPTKEEGLPDFIEIV